MTERRRGILDPWRTVDPVRPPPREPAVATPARQNLDEINFDADLAVPNRHVIRSTHACFDVISTRVETPSDALDVLADCVADAWATRPLRVALEGAGIGVRARGRTHNAPPEGQATSALRCDTSSIWFAEKPLDLGVLVLARILRMPEAAALCRRHGVTVMISA